MNIIELKKDKSEHHSKVTISVNQINEKIENKLQEIAKTVKMNGFRAGKVPIPVLRKKYATSIREDIARETIESAIKKIIKEQNLNIAFDPQVVDFKNEDNKDLEFTLQFELMPEITLPDFKKIKIEQPKLKVTDKIIDDQLNRISQFSKKYDTEVKTKAKKFDQVTIDAIGYVDGEAFEGGKLNAHKLVLGSGSFIPGFEDQLIGSKTGDEVSVKVDFPVDYQAKNLAGKPSEFKVKVLAVHKSNEIKLDDEFAKNFKCENIEELRKQISETIIGSYNEPINVLMKMKLFDDLEKALKFEVPSSLLDQEIKTLSHQTNQFSDDSDIQKMSEDEKKDYINNLALRRVRIGLMLAEYVKNKNLTITEDDIRQAVIAQARNYPGQEQQIFEFYQKNRNALENIKGPILEDKAVKDIFENEVTITEKLYDQDDLEKLLQNEIRD
ncbi:MAG: trigger factor [Rickettsiales bacterium]|nr:MAG: trigger factor [Rickettsiales bacterium]